MRAFLRAAQSKEISAEEPGNEPRHWPRVGRTSGGHENSDPGGGAQQEALVENDPRDEAAESRRSDADEPAKETPMDASMAAAPTNRDVPPDQRTLDER